MFRDRKVAFKEFELSTVTDYPTKIGEPTNIVTFKHLKNDRYNTVETTTVRQDLADFTGKDTLP